jgi:hypothetical protein
MSKLIWLRAAKPLALLVSCILLSGCSGQENIQLKKLDPTKDAIYELPKGYQEKRAGFLGKSSSRKIGHDPSGVNPQGAPPIK